jgi:hypothetical protein
MPRVLDLEMKWRSGQFRALADLPLECINELTGPESLRKLNINHPQRFYQLEMIEFITYNWYRVN